MRWLKFKIFVYACRISTLLGARVSPFSVAWCPCTGCLLVYTEFYWAEFEQGKQEACWRLKVTWRPTPGKSFYTKNEANGWLWKRESVTTCGCCMHSIKSTCLTSMRSTKRNTLLHRTFVLQPTEGITIRNKTYAKGVGQICRAIEIILARTPSPRS